MPLLRLALCSGRSVPLPATLVSATLVLALVLIGCSGQTPTSALTVEIVSSLPHQVSAGEARLAIRAPGPIDLSGVMVESSAGSPGVRIEPTDDPAVAHAVVTGLAEGRQELTVRAGPDVATVQIVNHPAQGPIFSGPAQAPFFCAVDDHRADADLGPVLDDDCTIATRVDFLYRSSQTGDFVPFDPDGPRPDDMATTTTLDGRTVDFIVRWERGTLNRFIYSIAMLSPETQDSAEVDRSAWNGRLIYYFQGGVGVGHYQGGPSRSRMLYPWGLEQGYAIAYSTGTRTAVHYDLEVGGETALMVKNRFVVRYGLPDYTVGVGGSGGGIQQYVYGQNHPGLIDAAVPQYSYPDMVTQIIHTGDCELLERYMDAEVERDPDSKWAVWSNRSWLQGFNAEDSLANPYRDGAPGLTECINGWRGLTPLALNPHYGTAPGISPDDQAATVWTHAEDVKQIYGMDEDGYAATVWDNVGVVYGLAAFRDGRISAGELIDLNARIGSWKNEPDMVQEGAPFIKDSTTFDPHSARNMNLSPDDTGTPHAPRREASLDAIRAAYERGLVFTGRLEIPIIDWRHYLEDELDMHNAVQSFSARQRILDHDGDASNQVIWFTDVVDPDERFDQTPMAFLVIDEWMQNVRAHPERTVDENKPPRAQDSCFDENGDLIARGPDVWDGILNDAPPGACARRFEIHATSRIVAGGPITGDVFKCRLQPLDEALDAGVFGDWNPTPDERARLEAVFPEGVCDYSQGDEGRPPAL